MNKSGAFVIDSAKKLNTISPLKSIRAKYSFDSGISIHLISNTSPNMNVNIMIRMIGVNIIHNMPRNEPLNLYATSLIRRIDIKSLYFRSVPIHVYWL